MDKVYLIKLKDINKDYEDDVIGNLGALFTDVVEFAKEVAIEEIE